MKNKHKSISALEIILSQYIELDSINKSVDINQESSLECNMSKYKSYRSYRYHVDKITDKNIGKIKGRSFNGLHVDHIVPVTYGYKNNIPVELISSKDNIRIISKEENINKGQRLTIKSKELLKKWGYMV